MNELERLAYHLAQAQHDAAREYQLAVNTTFKAGTPERALLYLDHMEQATQRELRRLQADDAEFDRLAKQYRDAMYREAGQVARARWAAAADQYRQARAQRQRGNR
jgi:hypothetical protein